MANFEVLSLDPTTPQIRAPGAGDGYSVPRDMTFATGTTLNAPTTVVSVNTSTDALRITQVGSGNALVVEDSANPDATPTVINASGNVGIGTTAPVNVLDIGSGTSGRGIAWGGSTGAANYNNIWGSQGGGRLTLATMLRGSTSVTNGYESSNAGNFAKSALEVDYGVIKFFTDAASAVPIGNAYTPTERMRLDSSGNLGIGTTSPANKLDVAGIIRTSGTGYSASGSPTIYLNNTTASTGRRYALNSDNSGIFQIADDTAGGASRLIIDASGNVGIGTASPLAKVNSQTGVSLSLAEQTYTGDAFLIGATGITAGINTYGSGITWSRLGSNGRRRAAIASVQTTADEDQVGLAFFTHPSTGLTVDIAESMRLDHNGNLGIGTTSPAAKTEILTTDATVYSTSTAQGGNGGLLVSNQLNNNNNIAQITFRQRNVSTYDTSIGASGGSANFLFFKTNGAERMRISSDGGLSIATTVAGSTFGAENSGGQLIVGSGAASQGMTIYSSTSTNGTINFADGTTGDTTYRGFIQYLHASDALRFATSANERARITSAGELLVGGTTAAVNSLITSYGNISFSGSGTGAKLQNRITLISVSTSATTIINAGDYGQLVIVNGRSGADRFCDLVMSSTSVAPTVVQSFTSSGSPAARTYTRSGVDLQLAMASGTYETYALALGF